MNCSPIARSRCVASRSPATRSWRIESRVAHRDGAVVERLVVDRDAERRADLVLAAVELADVAFVVLRAQVRAQRAPRSRARARRAPACCAPARRRRPGPARSSDGSAARCVRSPCRSGRRSSRVRRRRQASSASCGPCRPSFRSGSACSASWSPRRSSAGLCPRACMCASRSYVPRCAIDSSSPQPHGKRYSTSMPALA